MNKSIKAFLLCALLATGIAVKAAGENQPPVTSTATTSVEAAASQGEASTEAPLGYTAIAMSIVSAHPVKSSVAVLAMTVVGYVLCKYFSSSANEEEEETDEEENEESDDSDC